MQNVAKISKEKQKIYSVPLGIEFSVLSSLFAEYDFITYITHNEANISLLIRTANFFIPNIEIITMPIWDIIPYDRVSPSNKVMVSRLESLAKLLLPNHDKILLIISAAAVLQKLPPQEILLESILELILGNEYNREDLIKSLYDNGYNRTSIAEQVGDFAIRGSIIDIVINDNEQGFRLDFFGNKLDLIKVFNTSDQLTINNPVLSGINSESAQHNNNITKIKKVIIPPASEVILNTATISNFKQSYLKTFGIVNDPLYEAVTEKNKYAGMENWLPLFYKQLDTIFEYIPENSLIIKDHLADIALTEKLQNINEHYSNRLSYRNNNSIYNALSPNALYLNVEEIESYIDNYQSIIFTPYNTQTSTKNFSYTPNLYLEAKATGKSFFSLLHDFLNNNLTIHQKILISCYSIGSKERIKSMLIDNDFITTDIENINSLDKISNNKILGLTLLPIDRGCITEEYIIFSEQDLLGSRLKKSVNKRQKSVQLLQEINNLQPGELIVHAEYGIGRFQSLTPLKVQNVVHDFIEIIYLNDDKLYLPVENLELITKYGQNDNNVQLDKLGSQAWQSRKARLKERLKLAAQTLLDIAAKRQQIEAPMMEAIGEIYDKFCQKFPYLETEDQERSIQEVLDDLASGKPMDRLICGDVGFGKTEVALRAAAIATLGSEPMQVAVIVPTTLLSRQHTNTFMQRFSDFPINIKQLSKFTNKAEAKVIKENLKNGLVDIVIGTHALLAKDLVFKNLGLVIIDEEQHFGVAQKESLKLLKSNIHILSLSATPIPRTLQMAFADIKSLSLITSPPLDREPIKTFVMPYDAVIIREALLREKMKGGRSFYITPRVMYLDEIAEELTRIVPELKLVIAHGKVVANKLDTIMNDFYDGKFDILVTTNIIESGLDIPMANTIIIDRANMFGLSQLYQIRGRVGRSNSQAYAYLTTNNKKKITHTAQKKLNIIQSLDMVGAGFSIANHDMDIRGHGNLLGEEQSGHIKEVGIELYQKMLADTIESLRSEVILQEDWSPVINTGVSVQIPEVYIKDITLRLNLYRKIAEINTIEDADLFAVEMADRFGPLPEEAQHLFAIIKLKKYAKLAHISRLDIGEKALVITFRNNRPLDYNYIIDFIAQDKRAKLRPDGKLLILIEWERVKGDKFEITEKILMTLTKQTDKTVLNDLS